MKVLAPSRSGFFATTLSMCCLILAGCSTPTARLSQEDSDGTHIPDSWKPHLLYLLASPHSRLHVEVDAVEGCAPNEAALRKLRNFLSAYCNKPGGIEIVRGDLIPIKAAEGMSPEALARRYINGPNTNSTSTPAFIYVLFYNDALWKDSSIGKVASSGKSTATARRPQIAKPYATVLPYPAIYFNTRYFPWYWLGMEKKGLLHEAGHELGLVRRPTAVSFHCPSETCLMNTDVHLRRVLLGQQKKLCPECVAELAQSSTQSPPSNLRFAGAVLVRSEMDYHVLSLPDRLALVVGELTEELCQYFAARVRAETHDASGSTSVYCLARGEVLEFQEQALRTGNPTESEYKTMRVRLSLYQQSQPFLEKFPKPE